MTENIMARYEEVKVTCPHCGKTETVVKPKDQKNVINYMCPHCGWPENPISRLDEMNKK